MACRMLWGIKWKEPRTGLVCLNKKNIYITNNSNNDKYVLYSYFAFLCTICVIISEWKQCQKNEMKDDFIASTIKKKKQDVLELLMSCRIHFSVSWDSCSILNSIISSKSTKQSNVTDYEACTLDRQGKENLVWRSSFAWFKVLSCSTSLNN